MWKLKNSRRDILGWIGSIRETFDCDRNAFPLRSWEAISFILIFFSVEILDLFAYPKGFAGLFPEHLRPLNSSTFWVVVVKMGLGSVACMHLTIRYYSRNFVMQMWMFWLVKMSLMAAKLQLAILDRVSIVISMISMLVFFIYFFAMDPYHLDSLKLMIYSDLSVDQITGRIHKTPNSRISTQKLKQSAFGILIVLVSAVFITWALRETIEQIFNRQKAVAGAGGGSGGSPGTDDGKTENQKRIEDQFKTNLMGTVFSTIVLAPLLEEWMFRRFIMKMGNFKWWTIILSGFLFGLVHLKQGETPRYLVPYMVPGMVFASCMYVSKNIWHVITCHALYNSMIMLHMAFRG